MHPLRTLHSGPASADPANLEHLVAALRRRFWVVLACVAATTGAALAVAMSQPDEYSASSSLLFRDSNFDQDLFGTQAVVTGNTNDDRQAATNTRLVSLRTVAQRTADAGLTGSGLSAEDVRRAIKIAPEANSDVIEITATTRDPKLSSRMANAYADQYISFRRDADQTKILAARQRAVELLDELPESQRASERGRALASRAADLAILGSLQTGNAERVQSAGVPDRRSSPKPLRDALLGFGVGLVLGLGLALLSDRLDRHLRDNAQIQSLAGRPILGAIPEVRELRQGFAMSGAGAEAFHLLRANLRYFSTDARTVKSLLVSSAQPSDGKSTVSTFLAVATASAGGRAILIDADLRKPGRTLGNVGLSQVLVGMASLENAVRTIVVKPESELPAVTVDVLPSGQLPPNPVDLLASQPMIDLIRRCEQTYDLIIVDAPPITQISDAVPLVGVVSGVLIVARKGHTHRSAFAALVEQLTLLKATVIGVVVNSQEPRHDGYGYYYLPSERVRDKDPAPTAHV